jgi:type III restriction enzyme
MCRLIERECHLTGQFHRLAGLVKEYIQQVVFGMAVNMEEDYVLVRLNKPDAKAAIFEAFVETIRALTIQPQVVRPTGETLRFSDTPGYEWSRTTYPGMKTVFNLVACDNKYEADFASFLDRASDVAAYTKNNLYTHFSLDYQNSAQAIRYYYPDFIVRLVSGEMWLIETKGVEDVEAQRKDARAEQWCHDASYMTGTSWRYLKVPYEVFQGSTATNFGELLCEIVAKKR